MATLNIQGERLLALLSSRLTKVRPGSPQTYISYKEIHAALGLKLMGHTYGDSLKKQGLANLAEWTKAAGLPAITGIIVDESRHLPGSGYFALFDKADDDYAWWTAQVELSKQFDWSPYLKAGIAPTWGEETLRELITKIAEGWTSYRNKKVISNGEAVFGWVEKAFPTILRNHSPAHPTYIVQGSTGAGRITAAPWVATFDPSITSSATKGFYLVYLFSTDLKSLYLSIAFGTTQFQEYFPALELRHEKLRKAADFLKLLVNPTRELDYGSLKLAAASTDRLHKDYEQANIAAIKYDLDALPTDDVLIADYKYMLGLYRELVTNPLLPSNDELLESQIAVPSAPLKPIVKAFEVREPKKIRNGKSGSTKSGRFSKESKKVGDQGERIVYEYERTKVGGLGLDVDAVKWLAKDRQTPGWDITSVDELGAPIYIEVKSSVNSSISALMLTANEWAAASRHGSRYFIYLVTDAMKTNPTIEMICNPAQLIENGQLVMDVAAWEIGLAPIDYAEEAA